MTKRKNRTHEETSRIVAAAEAVGVTTRTIRNWISEGIDLDNTEALQNRKDLKAQRTKAGVEKRSDDPSEAPDLTILDKLPPPDGEGAVAALKRLQGMELIFNGRLIAEYQKGNSERVSFALADWTKVLETLRRYEKEVEENRRDLGYLIPKKEAQDGARAAAVFLRIAWKMFLSSSLEDLLPFANDIAIFKTKADLAMKEMVEAAVRKSANARLAVPEWAIEVITQEFHVEHAHSSYSVG